MMPAADLKHRAELARQRQLGKSDRRTAKPRKTHVFNADAKVQEVEASLKTMAYSPDVPEADGAGRARRGRARAR